LIRNVCFFISILSFFNLDAQTFTPRRGVSMADETNGFYEYLPANYNSSTSKYPLIIYLHGLEDAGNGDSELDQLLTKRLPDLIRDGDFPPSFTVGGQTHSFIVLCPQFLNDNSDRPTPEQVDDLITYAVENYSVDENRIYLTGFSLGGGAIWEYAGLNSTNANRIAAIVPIAGFLLPTAERAAVIAAANLPVWATHNVQDPEAPASWTNNYVDWINSNNPITPAKKTIFISAEHAGYNETYDPAFEENGLNIYEWMLQYQRSVVALPVTLTDLKATAQNNTAVVTWSTSSESNNGFFTVERSLDGVNFTAIGKVPGVNRPNQYQFIDAKPVSGDNFYRLSQTDQDGRVTYFQVLKLSFGSIPNNELSLRPSPAVLRIEISFQHSENGPITFALSSASGAVVKRWTAQKGTSVYRENVSLDGLQAGTYFLQVRGKTINYTERFIKGAH
ncbi:MAG TPA: T9SS type A sorting domain-containing protein, partial [Flavisolibacter sp.]